MKKLLALLLALVMSVACFASCGNNTGSSSNSDSAGSNSSDAASESNSDVGSESESDSDIDFDLDIPVNPDVEGYINLDDYQDYLVYDLRAIKDAIGTIDATIDAKVDRVLNAGIDAIYATQTVAEAKVTYKAAANAVVEVVPVADGTFNFSGLSAAEKTELLGRIEAYGIRNGMLGISLYENGGYVMYNDRITLGTENYIVGYGFGVLNEGKITANLDTEANAAWKRYYHITEAQDPNTLNYANDQGSQVGDLYYIGASYYTTFMNSTKDGYDWVPELAVADPVPVNGLDANGQASVWKIEVRTDIKYNTNSKLTNRKAFDGRTVAAEDYLTAFKLLLNQANGLYRGTELSNQTGAASIKGAKEYFDATKNASKGIPGDEYDFSKVGVKISTEGGKTYLTVELGAPVTPYYARYYTSSSLYSPIPKDFIDLVGVDNWNGFSSDKSTSPVDNSLSLGSYTLEQWDSNQQIVFKKNPYYVHAATKCQIEGIHINILTAAQDDKEANFNEFIAEKIDVTGIPDTKLQEYVSDPRTKTTTGDSVFKLNLNALDQESWIKLFGEDGTYSQTSKENYWTVEPALSNSHFRLGLSYALDRKSFAALKGCVASVDYFSSDYMSDPENGISYNATQNHKDALKTLIDGTDGAGFDLETARNYFRIALSELEVDGLITPGTADNPTIIELEFAWMFPVHEDGYHKYVKQYWENAFNHSSVSGGRYKLVCNFWVGEDYMACYDKILSGQFDVGFGSISGNSLDPLSFFNVNSTDPTISNNFTLNWAIDTNTVTEALVFNGKRWSFDALYKSSQELSIVADGKLVPAFQMTDVDSAKNADGGLDVTITIEMNSNATDFALVALVPFAGDSSDDYSEVKLDENAFVVSVEGNVVTITMTISADVLAELPVADNQGVDIYLTYNVAGQSAGEVYTSAFIKLKEN